MSGYPGAPPSAYPGQPGAPPRGYPGAPPQQGYPGAPPQPGYPGAPPQQGGYAGGQPRPGGYPGAPPQQGGYAGAPPGQGYPGAPPQPQGGYPGAPPQQQGGYPGARPAYQPGGGYQQGPPQGQVDPQVAQWFNAVDTDRSGKITATELQQALVNGNWSKFSEEACRMMIDMFDTTKTGEININDFGALFNYINQWKAMFEGLDKDKSGLIDNNEYTQALSQMGYRFSPTFVNNVLVKYSPRDRKMTLDNFIVSSVQIKRLTESFRARDTQMMGQATLHYEDFVGLAMGAHK